MKVRKINEQYKYYLTFCKMTDTKMSRMMLVYFDYFCD